MTKATYQKIRKPCSYCSVFCRKQTPQFVLCAFWPLPLYQLHYQDVELLNVVTGRFSKIPKLYRPLSGEVSQFPLYLKNREGLNHQTSQSFCFFATLKTCLRMIRLSRTSGWKFHKIYGFSGPKSFRDFQEQAAGCCCV